MSIGKKIFGTVVVVFVLGIFFAITSADRAQPINGQAANVCTANRPRSDALVMHSLPNTPRRILLAKGTAGVLNTSWCGKLFLKHVIPFQKVHFTGGLPNGSVILILSPDREPIVLGAVKVMDNMTSPFIFKKGEMLQVVDLDKIATN